MLSAVLDGFFDKCYIPLGDLMDDMALINSSINFLIYYFMSKQFRKTFIDMFGLTNICNRCSRLKVFKRRSTSNNTKPEGTEMRMMPRRSVLMANSAPESRKHSPNEIVGVERPKKTLMVVGTRQPTGFVIPEINEPLRSPERVAGVSNGIQADPEERQPMLTTSDVLVENQEATNNLNHPEEEPKMTSSGNGPLHPQRDVSSQTDSALLEKA